MADWINWFVLAGVVVILELFSGTFYLLMVAIGLACGGVAALLGAPGAVPMIVAAAVGVAATLLLRRSRFARAPRGNAARDPNVNQDIGAKVTVETWQDGCARVMYRGALWDVLLAPGCEPVAGTFTVREVQGSRLIVSNA